VISPDLARALDPDGSTLRPLPAEIATLLAALSAPARLAAHLRAVHDVAWQLTARLGAAHPALLFDRDAVRYGAASHDIGKVLHPGELTGPGSRHEPAGYELLTARGVPHRLARFARTHASWTDPDTTIDDHLVSLADKIWKAKRVPDLEDRVIDALAAADGLARWEAFGSLDDILDELATGADARLAYQARHPA
jgi:HD superfamily phosphodiesterase